MAKEDRGALARSSCCEVSQRSATQGDVEDHAAAAGASGGVASPGDQAQPAHSSDSDRPASEISEGHLPARHLVNVYEEDVNVQ